MTKGSKLLCKYRCVDLTCVVCGCYVGIHYGFNLKIVCFNFLFFPFLDLVLITSIWITYQSDHQNKSNILVIFILRFDRYIICKLCKLCFVVLWCLIVCSIILQALNICLCFAKCIYYILNTYIFFRDNYYWTR